MARANVAKKEIAEDRSAVLFKFEDGVELPCPISQLPDEIKEELIFHGIKQKVGDSYAGCQDPAEARVFAEKVWQRLVEGDWRTAREGGGQRVTDLAKALAAVMGKELDECIDVIDGMEKAQKSGLRKHPKIAAELARISAERAAEKAAKAEDAPPLDLNDL